MHECQDGFTSPMKCSQFGFTLRGSSQTQTLELICKGGEAFPPSHLRSDSIRTNCELRNSELSYPRRSSLFLFYNNKPNGLALYIKLSTPALCCSLFASAISFKISVYNVFPANFYRSVPSLPSYRKPCPERCLQNGCTSCSTLGW
jgi:hypothetical protein